MDDKYNKILNEFVHELKSSKDVLGIILYGSFAEKRIHAYSDIDLIVVTTTDQNLTRCVKKEDVSIQMLVRSYDLFKEKLFKETRTRPYSFYGKVLYDKVGDLQALLDEAKELGMANGPLRLTDHEKKMKQIALSQDLKTIEGLIEADNYEGASLLINEILLIAIECYYDHNGWFIVSNKRLINDLKGRDSQLGELASLVILSNDIKSKFINLMTIRNRVLDLIGGEIVEYEIDFKNLA